MKKQSKKPTPGAQLQRARKAVNMTQEQAAGLLGVSVRTWQEWEQGRDGRRYPPQMLELFKIKTKQTGERI